jgi:WD40 repeat protein
MGARFLLAAAIVTVSPGVPQADDPKPAHVLRTPADVTWIAFTPDSKHLLTGDRGGLVGDENKFQLRLWSAETGKLVAGPVEGPGLGLSGAISPDGRSAVTGGTAGEWRQWKLPDLTPTARGRVGDSHFSRVDRLAFRPDGKAFAVLHTVFGAQNAREYTVFTIDSSTGRTIREASWPTERSRGLPTAAAFNGPPVGWTFGNDPSFDAAGFPVRPEGRAAESLEVPGDDENCGRPAARAISRNGKVAVSAGCNGQVVVWDYATRKVVGEPLVKRGNLEVMDPGLAISADGSRVAVASMAARGRWHLLTLTLYDVGFRKVIMGPMDLGVGVGLVNALAFSPNGSVVAIAFVRFGDGDEKPTSEIQLWKVPVKK